MDKKREEQQELFEEFKKPKRGIERFRQKYISQKRFFVTVSVDHLILVSIIIIMLVVLSFSLGVERGKRIGSMKVTAFDKEVIEIDKETQLAERGKLKTVNATQKAKYTIQVIAYSQETAANREIASLKKEGFSAFMIPEKNLFHVCIGKYATLEEANADLKKVKKKYSDCFSRPIK